MYPTRHVPRWRVLLVDDSFSTRELLSMLLGCQGCIVSTAGNGAEAIEKLRSHNRPDVILLDLLMPVMDGWDFFEQLERDPELGSIPVLILSGADPDGKLAAKLKAPFLRKPAEAADLLAAIESICAGCRSEEAKPELAGAPEAAAGAGQWSGMG
jgi:CheY-like chemotaxis protein